MSYIMKNDMHYEVEDILSTPDDSDTIIVMSIMTKSERRMMRLIRGAALMIASVLAAALLSWGLSFAGLVFGRLLLVLVPGAMLLSMLTSLWHINRREAETLKAMFLPLENDGRHASLHEVLPEFDHYATEDMFTAFGFAGWHMIEDYSGLIVIDRTADDLSHIVLRAASQAPLYRTFKEMDDAAKPEGEA